MVVGLVRGLRGFAGFFPFGIEDCSNKMSLSNYLRTLHLPEVGRRKPRKPRETPHVVALLDNIRRCGRCVAPV